MNLRRIRTLYSLDLREAIRDGRILIAVLLPIGLAVYYALALPDPQQRVDATLHVVGDPGARFVEQVEQSISGSVDLQVSEAEDVAELRRLVADDTEAVGLVDPTRALRADGPATIQVVRNDTPSTGASLLESGIRETAVLATATSPLAQVDAEVVRADEGSPYERLGVDLAFGVFAIVTLSLLIALLAVPVLLMEEVTRRTLEALQMVATTTEIIVAKLGVGLTYCAIAVAITIPAAGFDLDHPVRFAAAALALSISLSGFGLAFGLALGDPGRVNTWSGVIMLPLFVPVFLALLEPGTPRTMAELLPTGAGAQLLADAAMGSSIDIDVTPYLVLAAWTAVGISVLARMLNRRDA